MNCRRIEKQLMPYLENELSIAEKQNVEVHLDQCTGCMQKLQYLRSTLSLVDVEKETRVKPFLYTRIQARQSATMVRRPSRALQTAWITAVLVIGMVIGVAVGRATIPTDASEQTYTMAYLFDDTKIERLEYQLLNDDEQ